MTFDLFEFFSINKVSRGDNDSASATTQWLTKIHYPEICSWLAADNPENFAVADKLRHGKFIQVVLAGRLDSVAKIEKNCLGWQATLKSDDQPSAHEMMIFMPFNKLTVWYHAAILREMLSRLQIAGGYPEKFRHLDNYEYCDYNPDLLLVKGGGYYEADPCALLLKLSGKSSIFGKYDKQNLHTKIGSCRHPFSEYQLLIA